jgi:hypothetical protein
MGPTAGSLSSSNSKEYKILKFSKYFLTSSMVLVTSREDQSSFDPKKFPTKSPLSFKEFLIF